MQDHIPDGWAIHTEADRKALSRRWQCILRTVISEGIMTLADVHRDVVAYADERSLPRESFRRGRTSWERTAGRGKREADLRPHECHALYQCFQAVEEATDCTVLLRARAVLDGDCDLSPRGDPRVLDGDSHHDVVMGWALLSQAIGKDASADEIRQLHMQLSETISGVVRHATQEAPCLSFVA